MSFNMKTTGNYYWTKTNSVFGRPFYKQSPYAIVVLSILSVMSVTLMYCGQTVGWPGDIVLGGDPATPTKRDKALPQFLVHVRYGQSTAWIKMPLCTEVGLGPGHIVLDWDPAAPPSQ